MKRAIAPVLFFVAFLVSFFPADVQSAAWWGEGARKDEWVLARGGSIIFYQVKGESNNPEYRAEMYLDGDLIESEKTARGVFDDAINSTYEIIIFKGEEIQASTEIIVRPGEEVRLVFDLEKDSVEKESEILPASEIRLNAESSQYIKPSDIIGFIPTVVAQDEQVSEAQVRLIEIEKVADTVQAEAQAKQEREEKIASLESDFEVFEQSFDQKLREAREGMLYWFRGPDRVKLAEAHDEVAEMRDMLLELRRLFEDLVLSEEKEQRVARVEEILSQKEALLEEREQQTGFWYRLGSVFRTPSA